MAEIKIREPERADMQLGVLIFTYPPDFSMAARAILSVRRRWFRTGLTKPPKFFWAVHKRDAEQARFFIEEEWTETVPADAPRPELIEHEFDAGGHLQCLSACGGMKKIYWDLFFGKETARGIDALIKLDSDVILLRPEQWTNPWRDNGADYVYIPQTPVPQHATADRPLAADGTELRVRQHLGCGACYLISDYAAHVIGSHPAEDFKRICFRNHGAEDRVFGIVLQDAKGLITSEISPKNFIGRSFDAEPDAKTSLILDNPKDNFGKIRYSWTLKELTNEN